MDLNDFRLSVINISVGVIVFVIVSIISVNRASRLLRDTIDVRSIDCISIS